MPPERDAVYLWDMLTAAKGLVASVRGLVLERYLADENLRLAVERRVEIIGEAARVSTPGRAGWAGLKASRGENGGRTRPEKSNGKVVWEMSVK